MKVEIWSDIACPFCWIGKRHFEQALANTGFQSIDVEWRSFELDPHAQHTYKDDLYTLLANKYGQTREWAVHMANDMKERGKTVGLEFNFDEVKSTNTLDAHRFLHLAKAKGLQNETKEKLFQNYFKQGKHVGEGDTLIQIAEELGMDASEVADMLESDRYISDVRQDEQLGHEFGVRGVPFFVIDRKYGISGAQPIEHFEQALKKASNESPNIVMTSAEGGDACDVDGCD